MFVHTLLISFTLFIHAHHQISHRMKAVSAQIEDHGLMLPSLPDKRNSGILVWVGDQLVPRQFASMSVFDSTVQVRRGCLFGLFVCLFVVAARQAQQQHSGELERPACADQSASTKYVRLIFLCCLFIYLFLCRCQHPGVDGRPACATSVCE